MKLRLREDTAGTLYHYPSKNKVPTNGTVTLYYADGTTLQASATATIDLTSTTVAAAAAAGATSFTVTATSGGTGATAWAIAAGIKYLVSEGDDVWLCECRALSSGTFYPTIELPFALTTNSTVKGCRLSYSATTTHTADRDDNYRAAWKFSHDAGSTYEYEDELFDVVAAPDWYATTYEDCITAHKRIKKLLDSRDLDLYGPLQWTWKQELIPLLRARNIRIERVRDLSSLTPLHVALVARWAARQDFEADSSRQGQYEMSVSEANSELERLLANVDWYDADDDSAADESEQHQIVRVRLVR